MSGLKRLKAAAMCGAGASFDAAEVEQLAELITEYDGVECTKHDAIVRGAVMRCRELEGRIEIWQASEKELLARMEILKSRAERAEKLAKEIRRIHGEAMVRVCGRAEKAEARAKAAEEQLKASEDRRNCQTMALKQVNAELEEQVAVLRAAELRAKIAELESAQESQCMVGGHPPDCKGPIR